MRALILCMVLSACGSTTLPYQPPDDAREQGLSDLRKGTSAQPVGRVADGWLVLPDGTRVVEVPKQWNAKSVSGGSALFEGTPGIALVFDHRDAAFACFDRKSG